MSQLILSNRIYLKNPTYPELESCIKPNACNLIEVTEHTHTQNIHKTNKYNNVHNY